MIKMGRPTTRRQASMSSTMPKRPAMISMAPKLPTLLTMYS